MSAWWGLALLGGLLPLGRAWRALEGTTLRHSWIWAALAWAAWSLAALLGGSPAMRYLALCLTACAGVAVLGARRPGAAAWDFVVAGLLALLSRPYLEGLGELRLQAAHLFILGAALAVGIANYLPTRQAPAALLLAGGCALEVAALAGRPVVDGSPLVAVAPWAAWWCARRKAANEVDAMWLTFRDRYGFVWAQRQREQFNRAAANAGLAVELGWGGLRAAPGAAAPAGEVKALLEATLRRFTTRE